MERCSNCETLEDILGRQNEEVVDLRAGLRRERDDRRFRAAVAFGAALASSDAFVRHMQAREVAADLPAIHQQVASLAWTFADAFMAAEPALDAPTGEVAP